MATKIFVNMPVQDLDRSVKFFTSLGYTFNAQFTDKNATAMVISEDIYAMLLVKPFFQTFTKKKICDTSKSTEVIIALSADSRALVDEMVDKAIAAGAISPEGPKDYGFMYERGFQDPDGHLWDFFWMDPSYVQKT
ncbi:MAG TPA: hypothetical protein PLU94_09965 [Methanoregulaceae archaeon]|nr:hypothetical protein [Methanoregulaceae archaeon]HPM62166.1 hypothetical protein [Methanoregulaceae archaeon]